MPNSVDPDEKAHYKLSHLDLHCLLRQPSWSAGLKELKKKISVQHFKISKYFFFNFPEYMLLKIAVWAFY